MEVSMIYISLLNGKKILINENLIETIEEAPDTIIKTTTGKKYVVLDKLEDLFHNINNPSKGFETSGV